MADGGLPGLGGGRLCGVLRIFAALILHEDGIAITADKIAVLVKASNVSVELYWPAPFAKLLEKRSVEELSASVGSGGGVAVAVRGGAAAATGSAVRAVEAVEEKKEPKEESDDDMGFSLSD